MKCTVGNTDVTSSEYDISSKSVKSTQTMCRSC